MQRLLRAIDNHTSWSFLRPNLEQIQQDISADPLSALENAKSILETISRKILNDLGKSIPADPSTASLVKSAFSCLPIITFIESTKDLESSKKLTGAIANIGSAIGEFRNRYGSIAHGKDPYAMKLDEHLIRFSLDSTDLIAAYLVELQIQDPAQRSRISYEDFPLFNQKLDDDAENQVSVFGSNVSPSLCLFYGDFENYKELLIEFRDANKNLIERLRRSGSYVETRKSCADINLIRSYLDDALIFEIAMIFLSNHQVYDIVGHGFTKNLYTWILNEKSDILESHLGDFKKLANRALY